MGGSLRKDAATMALTVKVCTVSSDPSVRAVPPPPRQLHDGRAASTPTTNTPPTYRPAYLRACLLTCMAARPPACTWLQIIGSDGGYRHEPADWPATGLFVGVAERYDVSRWWLH